MEAVIDALAYIYKISSEHGWSMLVVALAALILFKAFPILQHQVEEKGLGPNALKAMGIVLLLPIILVLGGAGTISGETLAALLGTIAGYIFGIEQSVVSKPENNTPAG